MSKGAERAVELHNGVAAAMGQLQGIYEARGGTGSVKDFLIKGATDPGDGKKEHWGTMTPDQQQLWNDLHATGLPDYGYVIMARQAHEDDD